MTFNSTTSATMASQQHRHFLVAVIENQSQINPARNLARRLVRSTPHTRVTLVVSNSAFRRMFPSGHRDEDGSLFSYAKYSDGSEDGFVAPADLPRIELRIKESICGIAIDLAGSGHPVTCLIYALLVPMAADAARELGIPSVLFWIQPAAVFAIYHRYFHGYAGLIDGHASDPTYPVELPGLPALRIRDVPTFLTTTRTDGSPYSFIYFMFEDLFRILDRELNFSKANLRVLVNSFEELEGDVLSSVDGVELIPIGPLADGSDEMYVGGDFFQETSEKYMEWLESKDEGSVVYVSFGSLTKLSKQQLEEISRGLQESGRPYLWVLRKDNKEGKGELGLLEGGEMGMVVEWCSQVRVLAHRSVGCFLTHCGWNSMLESLACGVPMVMMPQWSDQVTNAMLAEEEWGVGVTVEVGVGGEDRVVKGRELRRCVDLVMVDEEMRMRAAVWRERGRAAVNEGGSSSRNLNTFVDNLSSPMQPY